MQIKHLLSYSIAYHFHGYHMCRTSTTIATWNQAQLSHKPDSTFRGHFFTFYT
jgi:hypothetical protein